MRTKGPEIMGDPDKLPLPTIDLRIYNNILSCGFTTLTGPGTHIDIWFPKTKRPPGDHRPALGGGGGPQQQGHRALRALRARRSHRGGARQEHRQHGAGPREGRQPAHALGRRALQPAGGEWQRARETERERQRELLAFAFATLTSVSSKPLLDTPGC